MKFFAQFFILIVIASLSLGAAQIRQDGALKTFQKVREEIEKELRGPLETAGPNVKVGLGHAIEVLEIEKELAVRSERRLLKASIKQLTRFQRNSDFIGPKKARQIKEALLLAEQRLAAQLQKVGRA